MENRGERRRIDRLKAKARRKKLLRLTVGRNGTVCETIENEPKGKFRNNNIINKYTHYGRAKKTNRRKGHSTYRVKLGDYGVAMDWKPHDQRQLDSNEDNLKDNYNNNPEEEEQEDDRT